MTRETKIGLLVGLAFIIVIGILLSDYNRNDTQPAALALVADNVRAGSATMHNGSNVNEVVLPPAPTQPAHPVPTHDDLHAETHISIGPGDANPNISHPPTPVTPGNETAANNGKPDVTDDGNQVEINGGQTRPLIPDTIPVNPRGNTNPPVLPNPPTARDIPAPPTVNGAKQYVAIEGDTVSKLAGRFLGANTKTNREAILAINPTLKQNPNNVIVGRTYMIPPATASKPVVATGASPAPVVPIAPEHPVAVAPKPPVNGPQYFYTVKENDNLWRIAQSQLGDGNAWAAIKELNKDILKGKDDVRPNMRLRLPAKPIAAIE